jgi:hypothetical protein
MNVRPARRKYGNSPRNPEKFLKTQQVSEEMGELRCDAKYKSL